ncbi:NYN domain-containing protein [Streptomyces sp. NPDC098789]|uniref:NYN domain-containing protein n=1 Tax=Streptomyces sp. NPDC098789 TaxID=3366098 RepID=UPI00380304C6
MANTMKTEGEERAVPGPAPVRRWWSGWPDWAGYLAAVWSLLYGAAGVYWALGGDGYPFAQADPEHSSGSLLEPSRAAVVAPVIAVVGLVGAAVGLMMARRRVSIRFHRLVLAFGWTQAVVLTLILPDYTLLALVIFAPLFVVFAFTGVPGQQDGLGDILFWHRNNLIILFVGGVLWAAATLVHQRRARGLCVRCGRGGRAAAWTSPESAARWGRRAVLIAVLSSVPYEVTRLAWYFGYPLGITDAFLKDMQDTPGMLEIGLGLGVASAAGALLTHGLVHRWGEVWPRWVWFKAGKPVALATAIVPALLVSLVLIPGGVMMVRGGNQPEGWGTNYPAMPWILWGIALAAATLAYYLRRRGACRYCARG